MNDIPEFLYSEDRSGGPGYERFVYHTEEPRALFRMEAPDERLITVEVVQEIDKFENYPKTVIDEMMERLKAWWEFYKIILDETEDVEKDPEIKFPGLDDVIIQSIVANGRMPTVAQFESLNEDTVVKMAINGKEFWSNILEWDHENRTVICMVQTELDDDELKTGDCFLATYDEVWEIVQMPPDLGN